ncbi:hypothetical protein IEO21_07685 [Rhodonia placenta]|uniref:Uncharacterized protein n=1 Tax=Rhodonia placenta TaxID=104341 RepID=A0A8H7U034_9APHY|nr:hypothetical protein IEO21_07685 [Postia placenta]
MDTTRNNYPNVRSKVTDEERTFKKPYQTVGRPETTDHVIHEEYLKDPPHNQSNELSTDRTTRGLKEGAREQVDPKQEGVLGEETTGKISKESELGTLTTENSVHP